MQYTVETNGFINIWNTTGCIEKPYSADMQRMEFDNYHAGASTKQKNGKEIVSPAKRQYVRERDFLNTSYPSDISFSKLYWPSDTNQVDFSGMWKYPTSLTMYSRVLLITDKAHVHEFKALFSGAMKVWVNGVEVLAHAPYQSNIQQEFSFHADLEKGKNEIVVGYDDYGERNILFRFAIQNCGIPFSCSVETDVDERRLKEVKHFLSSLYLESFSYEGAAVNLYSDIPCPYDLELLIAFGSFSSQFVWQKGEKSLFVCSSDDVAGGFNSLKVTYRESDVRLESELYAETVPSSCSSSPASADIKERKLEYVRFVADNTKGSFAHLISSLYLGQAVAEDDMRDLEGFYYMIRHRGDCADFRMLRLLWIYSKWPHVFSSEEKKNVEALILSFRYWYDEPGNDAMWFFSENHALSFHVSEYIAGTLFPQRVFTNSGLTGSEHKTKARALLMDWFTQLFTRGYNEWNSITYIPVDLVAFFTLFELCDDEVLRQYSRKALDMTFSIFSDFAFKGMLIGSSGRIYAEDLFGTRTHFTGSLCRLAWGTGNLVVADCPLLFALSSYEPEKGQEEIANWNKKELYVRERESGRFKVRTYTAKNTNYIISSSSSPREGGPGSQEQLINVLLSDWRGHFWINHPGELKIWGTRRPGFFTGNALTPKVTQYQSSVLLSWNFPPSGTSLVEADYTQLIANFDSYDEVLRGEKYVILHLGSAFAFIYAENGLMDSSIPSLRRYQLTSKGLVNTWYVRVADSDEISFSAFRRYAEAFHLDYEGKEAVVDDFSYGIIRFPLLRGSNE